MRLRHLECRSARVKSDAVTTRRDFIRMTALGLGAGLGAGMARLAPAAALAADGLLDDIARRLTEGCRKVDPDSTDKMLELAHAADVVEGEIKK